VTFTPPSADGHVAVEPVFTPERPFVNERVHPRTGSG
jgi:hypothetical protein